MKKYLSIVFLLTTSLSPVVFDAQAAGCGGMVPDLSRLAAASSHRVQVLESHLGVQPTRGVGEHDGEYNPVHLSSDRVFQNDLPDPRDGRFSVHWAEVRRAQGVLTLQGNRLGSIGNSLVRFSAENSGAVVSALEIEDFALDTPEHVARFIVEHGVQELILSPRFGRLLGDNLVRFASLMPPSLRSIVVSGGRDNPDGIIGETREYDMSALKGMFDVNMNLGFKPWDFERVGEEGTIYGITLARKQVQPADMLLDQVWYGVGSKYVWHRNSATMNFQEGVLELKRSDGPSYTRNSLVDFHRGNPGVAVRTLELNDVELQGSGKSLLNQFIVDHGVEELRIKANFPRPDRLTHFILELPSSVRNVEISPGGSSMDLGTIAEYAPAIGRLEKVFDYQQDIGSMAYGIWEPNNSWGGMFTEDMATDLYNLRLTRRVRADVEVSALDDAGNVYQYSRPADDLKTAYNGTLLTLSPTQCLHEHALSDALRGILESGAVEGFSGLKIEKMKLTKRDLINISQFAHVVHGLSSIELSPSNGMSPDALVKFASELPPSVSQIVINGGIPEGVSFSLWQGPGAKLNEYDLSSLDSSFVVKKKGILTLNAKGAEPSGVISDVTLVRKDDVEASKL